MFKRGERAIKNEFGSKRGFVRSIKHQLLNLIGRYNPYKAIDFNSVQRLVFVCSGNICRSPLAEAVSRNINVPSESFGLHCRGGDPADPRAIKLAKAWELSLENHTTRHISDYKPLPGDLLVGMEPKHLVEIGHRFPEEQLRVTLAGLWLDSPKAYLHDPFNTNPTYFEKCEVRVIQSTEAIANKVKH